MSGRLLSTLVLLSTLLLACGGGANDSATTLPDDAGGVVVTPLDPTATSTLGPPPTPSTTPGVALTPQPGAGTNVDEARQLEGEGDIELAAAIYVNIAANQSLTAAVRSDATLRAGRLLLELEKPADARVLLEPFAAGASPELAASHYLLARAYAALGLWAESLAQYDAYIATGRPATPYAYLDRARDLLQLNQPVAAAQSAQSGLNLGVPAGSRSPYLTMIAQSNERAGNLATAIAGYNNLLDVSGSASDQSFALSRIIAIKRSQSDPTAGADAFRLLSNYPSSSEALTELTNAIAAGVVIDPTVRGLIYYRHNDYTNAEPAFRAQVTAAPSDPASGLAYYYLAAVQESRGDAVTAAGTYATSQALNPATIVADDALWWRGRIFEDAGKRDDARGVFTRIVNEYPQSSWATDAAFRLGMLLYGDKKYADAATAWRTGSAVATDPEERQRLTYWQGKALLAANQKDAGRAVLEPLPVANEDDYYGVRALSLLKGKEDEPKATRESKLDLSPVFDWTAAEAWLTAKTGRTVSTGGWSTDPRWLRAQELWSVGRSSQGDTEAFDLIEAYGSDAIAMYTMSRQLQGEGRIGMAGRAGQRLLRVVNTNPAAGLPKALLSLSYPAAFGPLVQKYAGDEKVSPLLLLAFMRQESFFDPRAESPVGALGLTQVLPDVGKSTGRKLGLGELTSEDLLEASPNLRVGANYMADQLKTFDNEIFVAFAAYNAGPNAAKRWRQAAGKDADAFVEQVEFTETRLYIQIVAENYAIYRYLYAGEPAPNLPD